MADTLRVLIVDDERLARLLLREYLGAHADVEIIGECVNGFEAIEVITEKQPDVVLLDVQMPRLTGFEVLELLDPKAIRLPVVVFCTAYDAYALRAFEVQAVDYLLKPFSRARFDAALTRARERVMASQWVGAADAPSAIKLTTDQRPDGQWATRVVVRDGTQIVIVPVERIDYLQAQDDYVAIHEAGRTHLKHQTLAELSASLDPARFVRIHRSYVVQLARIARMDLVAKDARVAVLHDGQTLPVSRSGHERLREQLG
jgi:two-component system LytT family response regulator